MKRFLHFLTSVSPFVFYLLAAIFLVLVIFLIRALFFAEAWSLVVLKNESAFVGHVDAKDDFVRIQDVYVLKKQSIPSQESWTSSFVLRSDIDPGFGVEKFGLAEVLISRSDIAFINPLSRRSLIIGRINQIRDEIHD
jgi:hypothetical protein